MAGCGPDRAGGSGRAPDDRLQCVRRFVRCRNATAEVRMRTFLSPCVDDCGPYGQCKLLRTHNYLYAACECKAGERAGRGWRRAPGLSCRRGWQPELRLGLEGTGGRGQGETSLPGWGTGFN